MTTTTPPKIMCAERAAPRSTSSDQSWWSTGALGATALMHAGGTTALVCEPQAWPWVGGALLANHAVLAAAGLVPRSALLGPNLTRLPARAAGRGAVALTFDDGPDPELTPRVLELLDAAGMKASFFLVGERVERYPAIAREIVRLGHDAENHSYRHACSFPFYGVGRARRDIEHAQHAIADATGSAPAFFRAPFGIRSPLLEPALASLGLRYVSWTRRGFDTVDRSARRVTDRLAGRLAAGDILLLHDCATQRSPPEPIPLAVLRVLLARLAECGLRSVPLRAACADDDRA